MAQIPNATRMPAGLTRRKSDSFAAQQPLAIGHNSTMGVLSPEVARHKIPGLRLGERKLLQEVGDGLVLTVGLLLILVASQRDYKMGPIIASAAVMVAGWFFFADAFAGYRVSALQSGFRSAYTAAKVLAAMLVAYILLAWMLGGTLPLIRPRVSETFEIALLIIPLLLLRSMVALVLVRVPLRRRVAVVGANRDGVTMIEALREYGGENYNFVGYFDDTPRLRSTDFPVAAPVLPTSTLVAINDRVGIDQIVLANPLQTVPLLSTLSLLHERGVQITPMFALYQDLTGRVPVSHLGNDYFVALPAHVKNTARTYKVVKRGFDLLLALVMLVFTAPVIPLVALAIKLDSPGPIFFKQVRVGRGGRPFSIVKFRSMRQDAEAATGAVWASDYDPRITRIGRFLRKSRLDEIPQLWNVFVGDMSFVGPRPERPEFDEELEREIPFYRARRAVRPGLTGWAQVSHGYGNTLFDALRKVEYDLYYIKNESLYLDLLILLRTVAVVLKLGGT